MTKKQMQKCEIRKNIAAGELNNTRYQQAKGNNAKKYK